MSIHSVFCSFLFLWYIMTNHNYKHEKVSLANTPHTWSYKLQMWMFHGRFWNNVLPRCIAIRAAVFSAFDTWALSNGPRGAKIFAHHRATEPRPQSRSSQQIACALCTQLLKYVKNPKIGEWIHHFFIPSVFVQLEANFFPQHRNTKLKFCSHTDTLISANMKWRELICQVYEYLHSSEDIV